MKKANTKKHLKTRTSNGRTISGSTYVRKDMQKEKESYLFGVIDARFSSSTEFFESWQLIGVLSVTPPEENHRQLVRAEQRRAGRIKLDNFGRYYITKPGIIRLNARKLFESIPTMVLSGTGLASEYYFIQICAFLCIWYTLKDCMTCEIPKEQALVLQYLWKGSKNKETISLDEGYEFITQNLCNSSLSRIDYEKAINGLQKSECIEIADAIVYLKESVSKEYP